MQTNELLPLSTIGSEPRKTVSEPNRDVHDDEKRFLVSVIRILSTRINNLLEVLNFIDQDVLDKTVSLADGTYLVACHLRDDRGNAFSFYLSTSETNDRMNWSKHAITCEHIAVYSWQINPENGEKEVLLHIWTIDPGGDDQPRFVENRSESYYSMAETDLKQLTDIAEQFNKVATHF